MSSLNTPTNHIAEGGSISLAAGDAFYDYYKRNQRSEMIGGSVDISAGSSNGPSETDVGGSVRFSAGSANYGVGGSVDLMSGGSKFDSSMFFSWLFVHHSWRCNDVLIFLLLIIFRWPCGDWFC